jgi:PKD repeat protein
VGTYTVALTAYNAQGQDTETKLDYIDVSEQPQQSCHVGAIDMADGSPPSYRADATVTVHDQDHAPLAGVTVAITWSGAVSDTDSDVTDENGQITFTSPKNRQGGTFTCTVDNLTKDGYPYQPGDNHETSDSITLP